jgi:hypothetical protein
MALFGDRTVPSGWSAGTALDCTVDTSRLLAPIRREILGVSLRSLQEHGDYPFQRTLFRYNLPMSVQQDIRGLGLTATAIGAGLDDVLDAGNADIVADRYDTLSSLWGIPKAQTVICVGSEDPGLYWQTPEELVDRIAGLVDRGYRIFEIESEPYRSVWGQDSRFPYSQAGEADYISYLRDVYRLVKQRCPQAQVLISVLDSDAQWWGKDMLSRAAGYYDGIALHAYQRGTDGANAYSGMEFQQWVVSEPVSIHTRLRELMSYAPVYITRWGSDSAGAPNQPVRDGNIYAVMAAAYRILLMLEEPRIRYAGHWSLIDHWWEGKPECGKFLFVRAQEPNKRGFLYWLYYYLQRYLGRYHLDVGGTAPVSVLEDSRGEDRVGLVTPVFAGIGTSMDHLLVVILNGSWSTQYSATIRLSNGTFTGGSGVTITHGDADHSGVVTGAPSDLVVPTQPTVRWNTVTLGLVPRSVTLLDLSVRI